MKNIPDLTLVDAGNEEDSERIMLQMTLFEIVNGGRTSITQDEYNKILSLFPDGKIACKYAFNSVLSAEYGIGHFILTKDVSDIIIVADLITLNGMLQGAHYGGIIHSNLTCNGDAHVTRLSLVDSSTIEVGIVEPNNVTTGIALHTGGDGTKALMDNGEYKEIGGSGGDSGVDITNYIADGLEFKSATTKEGFEKIRENILQNKPMYTFWSSIDSSNITNLVAFRTDVIAQALYGSVILVLFDAGNSKFVQLVIDPSNYTISKTQI